MFEEPLYSIADVAKITKLTDRTIRNYLAKGILKGKKIGGQWRFTDQDLCMLFSNSYFENDMKNKVENQIIDFFNKNETNRQMCVIFKTKIIEKEKRELFLKNINLISKKYKNKEGLTFVDDDGVIKVFVISSYAYIQEMILLFEREGV